MCWKPCPINFWSAGDKYPHVSGSATGSSGSENRAQVAQLKINARATHQINLPSDLPLAGDGIISQGAADVRTQGARSQYKSTAGLSHDCAREHRNAGVYAGGDAGE